jgi:pimeloyl-ACP methyl ester carboxylesterase
LRKGDNQQQLPLYVVGHDWGSVIALCFQNKYPELVKKLCLLDVGIVKPENAPIVDLVKILIYQWWWAIAYVIAQLLSFALGDMVFKSYMLFKPLLHPCPEDSLHIPVTDMTVARCYPYYQFWEAMLTGKPVKAVYPTQNCPLLFMWGGKKKCMFHDKQFLARVQGTEGSKALVVPDGGHWFAKTHSALFIQEIKAFFV